MEAVEEFILLCDKSQRDILLFFHHLFMSTPGVRCKIRYKIPFYDRKRWICYLNPMKTGEVELAFVRGNELSNSGGLLDSRGRKQVYGITFLHLKHIPQQAVYEIWQEALLLDEVVAPDSTGK